MCRIRANVTYLFVINILKIKVVNNIKIEDIL